MYGYGYKDTYADIFRDVLRDIIMERSACRCTDRSWATGHELQVMGYRKWAVMGYRSWAIKHGL